MLAAMSTHAKQLETAEVAYAAINEADKVILWQSKEFEKAGNSLQHDFKRIWMVFCYQNFSDLLWEKIVLVIE